MDKENRPRGRKKNNTGGSGEVHKRGKGLNMGGPIGNSGGYSERRESEGSSENKRYSSGSERSGNGASGLVFFLLGMMFQSLFKKRNGERRGCLGTVVMAAVMIVGVLIVLRFAGSFLSGETDGYQSSYNDELSQQSSTDTEDLGGFTDNAQGDFSTGSQFGGSHSSYSESESFGGSHAGVLDTSVSQKARPKRTLIQGDGEDSVTLLIYMCGTDLESKYGMATSDLQEMLNAKISNKVNIIVETGGTQKWQNSVVSNRTNQRYKVTSKGLELLEDNMGLKAMTDPTTLSQFIRYCKSEFPADRYSLILWDHGGGSVGGYGYDQNFPNSTMTLDKLYNALEDGNCEFDFIGFDACLMATLETAIMLEPFADYLIASEETEPGTGWYYTNWLTALSQNTSAPTLDIAKVIIDDFIAASAKRSPNDQTTLSIIDLAELKGTVPETFSAFSESTTDLINQKGYKLVSGARSRAKEFAKSSQINQVDLIHLAENMDTKESRALAEALRGCVKYNLTSRNISNANGISIYFPYGKLGKLDSMISTYKKIGMDSEYSKCISSFANVEAGGQMAMGSDSSSPMGSLLGSLLGGGASSSASASGGSMSTDLISNLLGTYLQNADYGSLSGVTAQNSSWIDEGQIIDSSSYYSDNRFHSDGLRLSAKNGGQVLKLPQEQWELIQNVELNVFLDDGSGYIDLGLDNTYDFDEDGDLLVNYDRTWLALNGQVVSYYFMSENEGDTYAITGRVPAKLNGELVDLVLVFTDENPDGVVAGARINYGGATDAMAKGLIEFQDGDVLDFLCDYYGYDEEFQNNYYLGEQMIVDGPITVSNVDIGNEPYKATYRLTDIYHNHFWTPAVSE